MAWIESHQSLARHPKLLRLSAGLGVCKAQAVGHLHLLWWWCLDYAPDGDVSRYSDVELSAAAEWAGKGGDRFVAALRQSGFLDDNGKIHDWWDYAGKLVGKREADRLRKRLARDAGKSSPDSVSSGCPADVQRTAQVPNPTQPNQPTNHTQPDTPAADSGKVTANGRGGLKDGTGRVGGNLGRAVAAVHRRIGQAGSDAVAEADFERMAAAKSLLVGAGVNPGKAADLSRRRDITPARIKAELADIARDDGVDDKAAVLVARLGGKGKR